MDAGGGAPNTPALGFKRPTVDYRVIEKKGVKVSVENSGNDAD